MVFTVGALLLVWGDGRREVWKSRENDVRVVL